MSDDDSLISELLNKIPGYGGYRTASKLRDDDRVARKFVAQRLGDCASSLDRFAAEAVKRLQLDVVAEVEKVREEVSRAQQRVASAIEGYSSFWESGGADDDAIEKAIEIDHSLVSTIDQIDSAAQACTKSPAQWNMQQFQDWTSHLHSRIDQRSELLDGHN
ncbi:MAG: hypothetical protein Aurels2KO_26530 [Aureliella sp.]